MKSVLRRFELVSGLRVNFKKTRVVGINVEEGFTRQAAVFLNCGEGKLSFRYLGLPVGADPKRISTREPIIESMQKKLAAWKGRHLSFGGRITLINSVLNSISTYCLSFLRMPRKVLKILTQIQRNFLGGGGG